MESTKPSRPSALDKVQHQIQSLQMKVQLLSEENKQLKQTIKELNKATKQRRPRRHEGELA